MKIQGISALLAFSALLVTSAVAEPTENLRPRVLRPSRAVVTPSMPAPQVPPSLRIENTSKIQLLSKAGINVTLGQLGAPVTLDIVHPSNGDTYGVNFYNPIFVDTNRNHASIGVTNASETAGEVSIWFKPLSGKSYIVACKVHGDGDFTTRVSQGSTSVTPITGIGEIAIVIQPYDWPTRSVAITSTKKNHTVNWLFYGCEITPVSM